VLAEIHGMQLWTLAAYGAAFSAFLIVLRLVWVFTIRYARYWVGVWQSDPIAGPARPARLQKRNLFLVGWTGLRGVLSLTAAISLPEVLPNGKAFPQRNMIVFLTFCVILTTLVLQGLTLPALIRKLGLQAKDDEVEREEEARREMLVAALDAVKRRKWKAQPEIAVIYDELEKVYESRLAAMPQRRRSAMRAGERPYSSRLVWSGRRWRSFRKMDVLATRQQGCCSGNSTLLKAVCILQDLCSRCKRSTKVLIRKPND